MKTMKPMRRPRKARSNHAVLHTLASMGGISGVLGTAQAQDLEPRSYANTPIGMNSLKKLEQNCHA